MTRPTGVAEGQNPPPQLAIRPKDAARKLGISARLLWQWTRTEGVPHVRIGNVVLYPVAGLERWLAERSNCLSDGSQPPA